MKLFKRKKKIKLRTYLTAKEILKLSNDVIAKHAKAVDEYRKGHKELLRKWMEENIDKLG